MTFDSYLYKTVVPANPLVQMKITAKTIGSLLRGNAVVGFSFGLFHLLSSLIQTKMSKKYLISCS